MADIKLQYDEINKIADLSVVNFDLAKDQGLENAVIISLFTDRLAGKDDILPASETHRRGWWGDGLNIEANDLIGSKLWLLSREKQTPEFLNRAEEYAREALKWLIDDGVVKDIEIIATAPARGKWQLAITILKADNSTSGYVYEGIGTSG